jgi:hypothetical protein
VFPGGQEASLCDGSPAALLLEWSDIGLPGIYKVAEPLFPLLARWARRKGIDRDLEARYTL